RFGDAARLIMMLSDLANRRHLGRSADDEALRERAELLRQNRALLHLHAALLGELDHSTPRDSVKETVRSRSMQNAVLHEEDIGARALSDVAAPVEHQRVCIAGALGAVLLESADHVQPGRLRLGGGRARIRAPVFGKSYANAAQPLLWIEVG